MKRLLSLVMVGTALTMVGCATVQGTWSKVDVNPPAAEGELEFGKITLAEDGDYSAMVEYDDTIQQYDGTYTYDKNAKEITFVGENGTKRTYTAYPNWLGNKLVVKGVTDEGKDWTATMKRQ